MAAENECSKCGESVQGGPWCKKCRWLLRLSSRTPSRDELDDMGMALTYEEKQRLERIPFDEPAEQFATQGSFNHNGRVTKG